MSEHKEPATSALQKLYEHLDPWAEKAAKHMNATCTKGCVHCCHLLALATFIEGLLIAERLLSKPDWKALLPKLKESALHNDYEGINKVSYFAKRHPCVFLDTKEKVCTIYEYRPSACRYHYVVSPPSQCSPDFPDGKTGIIDLLQLEGEVWKLSSLVEKQVLGLEVPVIAPIPIMVLYCMELITRDDKDANETVRLACYNIPSPLTWLRNHAHDIMEEGGVNFGPTKEELRQVMK